MRRRKPSGSFVEPPARLRCFEWAEWLSLVDDDGYDPERYRNRMNGEPVGEVHWSLENWRRQQAMTLWTRARMDWQREHGWPGGLDSIDLLRETRQIRQSIA